MLSLKSHQEIIGEPKTLTVHASTVFALPDGRVLAAWFGGSKEGNADVGIWLAEKTEQFFGPPRLIAGGTQPHWNPVLFWQEDGKILLFFKIGFRIPDWQTFVCVSEDGGRSFSEPRELVEGDESGGRGPVRNHPIRLRNGRILAPASTERGIWKCFADISDDDGKTWRRSETISVRELEGNSGLEHGRGIIQPAFWEDVNGIVHALMRSGEGYIYSAVSEDKGETWTQAEPTELPNNNSGIDVVRMEDGTLILACNPVSGNFAARSPLSLFKSKDNGGSWTKLFDVESGEGEFSYPSLACAGDTVFLTYTVKRKNIAYWEFLYVR